MKPSQIFLGELIGTFILVLIGCGSVALAVVYEFLTSIYEVALCWTIGVILGIYSSSKLSGAHLNPAVSAAFLVDKQISPKSFIVYLLAQFIGAFTAGLTLFLIIMSTRCHLKSPHGIITTIIQYGQKKTIWSSIYKH